MTPMRRTFWRMLQDYLDDTGATEASVMRRAGLNKGAFAAWRRRGIPALPSPTQLVRLSRAIKVDYEELLDAILWETGHLPLATAELIEALEDETPGNAGPWIDVFTTLGAYTEAANGDAQQLRALLNRDIHDSAAGSGAYLNAVLARLVLDGQLQPSDALWEDLAAEEVKEVVRASWASRRRVDLVHHGRGSGKTAAMMAQLDAAAREGVRRRSSTDRAQNAAGEENQDPGGADPA